MNDVSLTREEIEHPYANLAVMLEDKRRKAEQMSRTVFDRITASPEVLAEYLVYWEFNGSDEPCGWRNTFDSKLYDFYEEAIAATVAKLKEAEE